MLNNIRKKISVFLLCSTIMLVSALPTYAGTIPNVNVPTTSISATSTSGVLADGGSSIQNVPKGGMAIFSINVPDNDARQILVTSSVPVKSTIVPQHSVYANFIRFDSGAYRLNNLVGLHFVANVPYILIVEPLNPTMDPVSVEASMSKNDVMTWLNCGSSPLLEQNMLTSGQNEIYGLAFQTGGTYRITISTVSKMNVSFLDTSDSSSSRYSTLQSSSCVFTVKVAATGQRQDLYAINLTNIDTPNNGGAYTVRIEKIN